MNIEEFMFSNEMDMLSEMLDESNWTQVIDCKHCGHVPAHASVCPERK